MTPHIKRQVYGKKSLPSSESKQFIDTLRNTSKTPVSTYETNSNFPTNTGATSGRAKIRFTLPGKPGSIPKKRSREITQQDPSLLPSKRSKVTNLISADQGTRLSETTPASHSSVSILGADANQSQTIPKLSKQSQRSVLTPTQPFPATSSPASPSSPEKSRRMVTGAQHPSNENASFNCQLSHLIEPPNSADCLLLNLCEEVLGLIMYETLPMTNKWVKPYYCRGMLENGLLKAFADDGVIEAENVPLQIMTVCKTFHSLASRVYYGQSGFFFDDPNACAWWIRRIGDHNMSHVRTVAFMIGTGYEVNAKHERLYDCGAPVEGEWLATFVKHIQPVQRFSYMELIFERWLYPNVGDAKVQQIVDIQRTLKCRDMLCEFLCNHMRGVNEVQAFNSRVPWKSTWLTNKDLNDLADAIQSSTRTALPLMRKSLLPLSQSLAVLKGR